MSAYSPTLSFTLPHFLQPSKGGTFDPNFWFFHILSKTNPPNLRFGVQRIEQVAGLKATRNFFYAESYGPKKSQIFGILTVFSNFFVLSQKLSSKT